MFHYISYDTVQEAERVQRIARRSFCAERDRIQGASAMAGSLDLGGTFWYVFETQQPLSSDQMKQIVSVVPSCGHALNLMHPYG